MVQHIYISCLISIDMTYIDRLSIDLFVYIYSIFILRISTPCWWGSRYSKLLLYLSGLPEPPFLAGAGAVFLGPSPAPSPPPTPTPTPTPTLL